MTEQHPFEGKGGGLPQPLVLASQCVVIERDEDGYVLCLTGPFLSHGLGLEWIRDAAIPSVQEEWAEEFEGATLEIEWYTDGARLSNGTNWTVERLNSPTMRNAS